MTKQRTGSGWYVALPPNLALIPAAPYPQAHEKLHLLRRCIRISMLGWSQSAPVSGVRQRFVHFRAIRFTDLAIRSVKGVK